MYTSDMLQMLTVHEAQFDPPEAFRFFSPRPNAPMLFTGTKENGRSSWVSCGRAQQNRKWWYDEVYFPLGKCFFLDELWNSEFHATESLENK